MGCGKTCRGDGNRAGGLRVKAVPPEGPGKAFRSPGGPRQASRSPGGPRFPGRTTLGHDLLAAVHVDDIARDPTGPGRAEGHHGIGHVLGSCEAA